jgi:hypothetical protein
VNNAWNQWVLGYNDQRQKELLRKLGLDRFGWQGAVAIMAGAIALVLAGVAIQLGLRARGRPDRVVRAYQRYCRRLERVGLGRAPQEGPWNFARRAAAARPDLAPAIDEITALYVGLRYGTAAPALLPRLRAAVARFRPRRAKTPRP